MNLGARNQGQVLQECDSEFLDAHLGIFPRDERLKIINL